MNKKIRFFVGAFLVGICSLALSFKGCKCMEKKVCTIDVGPKVVKNSDMPSSLPKFESMRFWPVVRLIYDNNEVEETDISYFGSFDDFIIYENECKPLSIEDEGFQEVKNAIDEYKNLNSKLEMNYFCENEEEDFNELFDKNVNFE